MAVGIEDILLLKAQQDAQSQPDPGIGAVLGAGIGGTAGVTMGSLVNRLRPPGAPTSLGTALKPGPRMAGGLVGLILGGALGAGTAQAMKQNSPAAELLATLQVQGELSAAEQNKLQRVLADTYSQTLGM